MTENLVTVATFGDHTQAVVIKTYLEETGIPAFLDGEWMSQAMSAVGGGTKILVPASRLEDATRLINERGFENSEPVDWSSVDVGRSEDESDA